MPNFNLYLFFLECYYPELNTNILRKIEYFQDKPDLKKKMFITIGYICTLTRSKSTTISLTCLIINNNCTRS